MANCLVRVTAFLILQKHLHREIFLQWCIIIIIRGSLSSKSFQSLSDYFGDQSASRSTVYNWYKEFQFSWTTFEDIDHCGHPVIIAIEQSMAKVKCLIKADPQITENKMNAVWIFHWEAWMRSYVITWLCRSIVPFGAPPADQRTEMR